MTTALLAGPTAPTVPPDVPARRRRTGVPIVDIGPAAVPGDPAARRAASEILEAAMDNGFLYLVGHGVPESLIDAVYERAAAFFALPDDVKGRSYIGAMPNHRGYVPVTERGDYDDEQGRRRYEAFDLGAGNPGDRVDPTNRLVGPNVWPAVEGFRLAVSRYLSEMRRVSRILCNAFESALGLRADTFWNQMQRPVSQLRLLHYLGQSDSPRPAQPGESVELGMGAHTDYECFTILHSRTPSLEILDFDGRWIDAPPVDGAFSFNIGDLFEAWTGGLLVATAHRVVHTGQERFSIPYFCATDYDAVIRPVACPGLEDRQRHYPPIVAGHHLHQQLLRDFPYLRAQHERHQGSVSVVGSESNPFEHRIRAYA